MLTSLGTYDLDARIDSYRASVVAFSEPDYSEMASSGMKREFKNESFYSASQKLLFGRVADKVIIGTIDDRIYKVFFEFTFPNATEQMAFVKESSEICDDFLDEYEQAGNPPPKLDKKQSFGTVAYKWSWSLANLVVVITPISSSWCLTSNNVKNAKRLGFRLW
jgi:hypothetical protein